MNYQSLKSESFSSQCTNIHWCQAEQSQVDLEVSLNWQTKTNDAKSMSSNLTKMFVGIYSNLPSVTVC